MDFNSDLSYRQPAVAIRKIIANRLMDNLQQRANCLILKYLEYDNTSVFLLIELLKSELYEEIFWLEMILQNQLLKHSKQELHIAALILSAAFQLLHHHPALK